MPTTTPFNNLITFSRGSNATVTGSNGLIQWAPNNLLTFSEQFDNAAAWPKTNATVTANAAIAPDGSSTADLMYPTTTGTNRRILRSTTLTVGTAYAQSVYVKAAGKQWVYLNGIDASGPDNNCWFDLQNGVVGTKGGSVLSAGISAVGGGWYRIFTVALAGANNYFYLMGVDGDNTITSTTNGTDGILIWGAQLELGSTATTYNPTTVKNLLGFSEAFDNAAWTKTGASIVTGAQANPINGLFNAQKLMENTANAQHRVTNSVTLAAAPHTLSAYLKAGERTWALMVNGTIANGFAYFNLSTGVVGSVGAGVTAASIAAVGSGWYRCAITFTAPAGSNGFEIRTASADGISIYTGDGNSGVYIYGAQLSDSASLDPYVPTPGAAPSSTAFYGPRFDFDPVTLLPRGLLVEEQRTNLATYSEDFSNAVWTAIRSSITTNTAVAPDGTTTADKLVEDTSALNTHVLNRILGNPLAAATYTYTVYLKESGRRYVQVTLIIDPAATNLRYAVMFDLESGAVTSTATSGTPPTALANSIQNTGNGWYRCSVTVGNPSGLRVDVQHSLSITPTANVGSIIYTGDGTSGAFVYGAQLEVGAFATSYIPTVASTVTRSADVATITGQNFAQWYRQDEGAIAVEGSAYAFPAATSSNTIAALSDGGTTNASYVYSFGSAGYAATTTGGVVQANPTSGAALSVNTPYKMGYAFKVNDFAFSVNGAAVGTDASGTIPTVNQLQIGRTGTSILLSGHIRNIRFIPARAADFQLQGLST